MSKITAIDVANFFIDLANHSPEDDITNLKVNKLVYFAQGWSLAKFGKPLFSESIQAWKHGPVVKAVYNSFNQGGKQPIPAPTDKNYFIKFSSCQIEFLIDIYNEYGKFTAGALTEQTHLPGTPWSKYYKKDVKNITIPQSAIKEYFENMPDIPSSFSFDVSKIKTVGYRDTNGHYIIPKDEDDEEYEDDE